MSDYWTIGAVVAAIIIVKIVIIKIMTAPANHSSHSALIDTGEIDPEIDPEKCLAPAEDLMPDLDVYDHKN